jgi:hypothetical protein
MKLKPLEEHQMGRVKTLWTSGVTLQNGSDGRDERIESPNLVEILFMEHTHPNKTFDAALDFFLV